MCTESRVYLCTICTQRYADNPLVKLFVCVYILTECTCVQFVLNYIPESVQSVLYLCTVCPQLYLRSYRPYMCTVCTQPHT